MSGRRTKTLRKKLTKKMAVGAMVAYSAFGSRLAMAQGEPVNTTPEQATPIMVAELKLRRFEIAAGPLDAALRAFETASGVTVRASFPSEILTNLTSSGVSGTMTSADALARLLDGTGIEHRMRGREVVLTMQGLSEAIDVEAAVPAMLPMYPRPIVDTPRTINIITSETMIEQGATTLRDVLRNSPGITFQAGEGGGGLPGDTFSLRGFSSGNDITLDGVREVGSYTRDAFNLEQVEVLKGPSGTAAGRGATGGSINLVTKTAKQESFTHVTAGSGSAGYERATVDANTPVGDDAGFRINAMFTESGVAGRDVVHNSAWGIAPTFTLGIGKPSRFTLSYQHLSQDNVPDYGLPWAAIESSPRADQSNFYGLEGYDYEDVTNDAATATFEHDFRETWTLRNISRWVENHRDSAITAPRPPNRQLQQRLMDHGQLANHTSLSARLGGAGRVTHDVAFGVQVGRETTFSRRQAQTTNQPQTNLADPDPSQSPFGPMPKNVGNPEETTLDLLGIYAFDTLSLGNRWELTGGLRMDAIEANYELRNVTTGTVTPLSRTDRMPSWSVGAVYKPRRNASLYASAGTSFNASVEAGTIGAALSDSPTAVNNINLDPEETRNLELGAKWELRGGRAVASAALFRTEKTNARTRSVTTEPFVLDGEQQVSGVEIGINGRIVEGWNVIAGYALLDSEFTASKNPAEQGAQLAFVPEHSFSIWNDVRLSKRFSTGAGAQYMDSVFRNATNTTQAPSYWLLSAMAAYQFSPSLTLRLNVDNLADAEYVDRVGGGHYIPGPGRSAAINVEFGF